MSALVVCQEIPHVNAMAILGTSLTDKHMERIAEYDNIIVALDPDAAHKTLQYKREVEAWTGLDTRALRLDDDIKYKLVSDTNRLRSIV